MLTEILSSVRSTMDFTLKYATSSCSTITCQASEHKVAISQEPSPYIVLSILGNLGWTGICGITVAHNVLINVRSSQVTMCLFIHICIKYVHYNWYYNWTLGEPRNLLWLGAIYRPFGWNWFIGLLCMHLAVASLGRSIFNCCFYHDLL